MAEYPDADEIARAISTNRYWEAELRNIYPHLVLGGINEDVLEFADTSRGHLFRITVPGLVVKTHGNNRLEVSIHAT